MNQMVRGSEKAVATEWDLDFGALPLLLLITRQGHAGSSFLPLTLVMQCFKVERFLGERHVLDRSCHDAQGGRSLEGPTLRSCPSACTV